MGQAVMPYQLLDDGQDQPQQGYRLLDEQTQPTKIGADAFPDFLKAEIQNASPFIRNLAGAGTALSNVWEGAKQLVGQGNEQNIANNKILSSEAPVGSFIGNAALTAIPFGMVGNSVRGAAAVGAGIGALEPVSGDQGFANVAKGKLINAGIGAATGAAGQVIANKSGDWIAKKVKDFELLKSQRAPIDKTLSDALDAGLKVPPSSVNPSFKNTTLEGIGGKIATAQEFSNLNAPLIDNMARQAVGLAPDEALTSTAMQQVRNQAYKTGYEPVAQLGQIPTDKIYADALDALVSKHQGAAKSFPGAFKGDIQDSIGALKTASFDAGDALKASQLLRDEANAAFRSGDNGLGFAKKGAAKAIEDQIERTLSASGQNGAQVLQGFREARQVMAKAHTVEDAIVEGGGSINPRKLAQRVQAGKPMTGELATIGNFANNFPRATQPAAQIAGPGVSKLNSAMALMGGGGGAVIGGPVGAVAGAAAPFIVPPLVRKLLLSGRTQNQLAQSLYQLGLPTRTVNALLQYAPVGGTVAGLNAFGQ